jgi:hypothetical protein
MLKPKCSSLTLFWDMSVQRPFGLGIGVDSIILRIWETCAWFKTPKSRESPRNASFAVLL